MQNEQWGGWKNIQDLLGGCWSTPAKKWWWSGLGRKKPASGNRGRKRIQNIFWREFIGPAVGKEEDLRGRGKGKENSGVSPE